MDRTPEQDTFGRLSAQDKLMMESPSASPAPKEQPADLVQRPRAGSIQQQQNDQSGEFLKRIQMPKKIEW